MIELWYYVAAIAPTTLANIGVGIGEGFIGTKALEASSIQPAASDKILKTAILGIALAETTALLGTIISLLLILDTSLTISYLHVIAVLGISIALGIPGFAVGFAAASPAQAACTATARQPFMHTQIFNLMLITQTLITTSTIFGFLISLLIKNNLHSLETMPQALQLCASGLSIGIGSLGPIIGLSTFATTACTMAGRYKYAFSKILTFTFLGQAIVETPLIFSLIVSLSILMTPSAHITELKAIALLAAALSIGLSTIPTGISAGKTSAATCTQIAQKPEQYAQFTKMTLLALAMIDTSAIYGLIVSMMLIFFV